MIIENIELLTGTNIQLLSNQARRWLIEKTPNIPLYLGAQWTNHPGLALEPGAKHMLSYAPLDAEMESSKLGTITNFQIENNTFSGNLFVQEPINYVGPLAALSGKKKPAFAVVPRFIFTSKYRDEFNERLYNRGILTERTVGMVHLASFHFIWL